MYDLSPNGSGFISGKLPMTEDKDFIFTEYTVVAVVHMICTLRMSYQYYVGSAYNRKLYSYIL